MPSGAVLLSAQRSPAGVPLASTVIGNEPAFPARRSVDDRGTQSSGDGQPVRILIKVADPRRAQRDGQADGIQPDRVRPGVTTDHQYLGSRLRGQLRADGAPGIGDVVARAGHRDRVHIGGKPDEHGVGMRHADQVGEEAAPLQTAHRAEPVARHPRVCRAVAGWQSAIADAILARGLADADADQLATLVLAAIEGGLLLARANRDGAPLRTVGRQLAALLRTRVP